MSAIRFRHAVSLGALSLATFVASPALAQSRVITGTNVVTVDGPVSVTLNGDVFVNKGMVGAGRLDANTRDFAGETMGSFSGMELDLKSWRRNADGSYAGTIYTLPDRGPNDVGGVVGTINYRNRVNISQITLRPYTGTAALPQSIASQNQVTITPTGGFFLTDTTGVNFTGKDALGGITTRNGVLYPLVQSGDAAGRISLDSEAITFRPDGSFYVSDEYAANIYYFDPTGRQLGALNTIPAILPRTGGLVNFDGGAAPQTGRRNNQGLEALDITPDNTRLVTILQSATMQDTAPDSQQNRNNTRILVYDISTSPVPNPEPIGHYVLQLPVFNSTGTGNPNRTAAQSEMLALNNNQFLVLSRDGIGRGSAPTASTPVFKSVLLVDITNATNLTSPANAALEALYEDGTTSIAAAGTLAPGIVPAQQVELVNMLNSTQLGRFGMNLNARPSTATSLSEKWEALALAPVLEESAPQDYFLFIGNDNDFITNNGQVAGLSYDASLSGTGGTGNNDSLLLVYRLTLPTYVDPLALAALNATAPAVLTGTRIALNGLGASTTVPAMNFLNAQRGWGTPDMARRVQLWADGGWSKVGAGSNPATGLDLDTQSFTMGVDVRLSEVVRIGGFGGYRKIDGNLTLGEPLDVNAWTAGAYIAAELPQGIYGQAVVAWLGDAKLKRIGRLSAYGQEGVGESKAHGWAASGELGWMFQGGQVSFGPFAGVDYTDTKLNGWTESGASVSNLIFPNRSLRKLTASVGGELGLDLGALRPTLRAGYSLENEHGDQSATVRLASAQHVMGTVVLPLASTERDSAFAELRVAMRQGPLSGYVSAKGRWGRGDDDARVSLGVSYAF